MSMHALVEKWRGDAKQHREQFALLGGEQYNAPGGIIDMAITCEEHADELEAALAGGGEAVAWGVINWADGSLYSFCETEENAHDYVRELNQRGNIKSYATPLFTHPAGAVQVTDEMVERGVAAYQRTWDAHEASGDESMTFSTLVRAALTAALNPGGSRE